MYIRINKTTKEELLLLEIKTNESEAAARIIVVFYDIVIVEV